MPLTVADDSAGIGNAHGQGGIVGRTGSERLRQPEIENLHASFACDQDIVGLQIAVKDAPGVRGRKPFGDLHRHVQQLPDTIRPRDRRAFHELHHQIVRTDVVKLADVGMIQRGDGSRLSLKALIEIALSNLDRDDPIQTGVASLPHFSHTTGAETRQDFVRSEFLAGGERHSRIQFILADRTAIKLTAYPEAIWFASLSRESREFRRIRREKRPSIGVNNVHNTGAIHPADCGHGKE